VIQIAIQRKRLYVAAALIAAAALLIPATAWASHQFTDVPTSDWAHDDIAWLKDNGLTNGCEDGTKFCPDNSVTRRETAAFMHRLTDFIKPVVGYNWFDGGSGWEDSSNPRAKKLGVVVTLESSSTVTVNGGAFWRSSNISPSCWLVWNFEPDRPLIGGVLRGSDRAVTDTHGGELACQTSGAVELEAGTYRIDLYMDQGAGSNHDMRSGSIQVVAVPK